MDDAEMVEQDARQFVQQHGTKAVDVLGAHADIAATQGNGLSRQAWLDITDADPAHRRAVAALGNACVLIGKRLSRVGIAAPAKASAAALVGALWIQSSNHPSRQATGWRDQTQGSHCDEPCATDSCSTRAA